jgi:signal transduction histidine kinase
MVVQDFFTRTAPYRWALEPALAVVVFLIWGSTTFVTGRVSTLGVIGLFAAAIALSRLIPLGSIVLGAVSTLAAIDTFINNPTMLVLVFVAGCIVTWGACLYGGPALRYIGLAAALLIGVLLTFLFMVSVPIASESTFDELLRFIGLLGFRLSVGFLGTVVLVGGWVFALVLRGRADRRASVGLRGDLSAETWLMTPTSSEWLTGPSLFSGRPGIRLLSRHTLLIDAGIAGAFLVFGLLVDPYGSVLSLVVLLTFTLALAVRRLSPSLALAIAWVGALSQMLAGLPVLGSNIAILGVLYATAIYGERVVRWAGLASVGVGSLLAGIYLSIVQRANGSPGTITQGEVPGLIWTFVMITVASLAVLGLSWTLGLLVRTWKTARDGRLTQHRAVEEQRLAQQSVVVEQERNRIARDMHDVVAHSLAVVIAQADGARYARAQNPEAVDAALTTISTTARDALGDVRILLTRLRQDDAAGPQPVLADLDRLITQMRSTGLDIEWTTTGTPTTLGSGAQLAVYRIVQEALTNALRHGDAGRAVYLSLAWTDGWVAVTIDNAVRTDPVTDHGGEIGHGLPGMRERALLAGGSLAAESIGGRFIVAARLPAITTNALVRPDAATLIGPTAPAAGYGAQA